MYKEDPLEFESLIREALPGALVNYCANYDDYYHGWDISPVPGVVIQFKACMTNQVDIKITKCIMVIPAFDSPNAKEHTIFCGKIPLDEYEPDFAFIKKLLYNWRSIG